MWLPRDERYLLVVYYVNVPELNIRGHVFSVDELKRFVVKPPWIPIVGPKKIVKLAKGLVRDREANRESIRSEPPQDIARQECDRTIREYGVWLEAKGKIEAANSMLRERGLIEARECGTGFYEIEMKLKGLDLGRKYANWLERSGLLFAEYRNHWIWVIVSFFGGVFATLLVQWLSTVVM